MRLHPPSSKFLSMPLAAVKSLDSSATAFAGSQAAQHSISCWSCALAQLTDNTTAETAIRYRFRLLALDQPLELSPGLDKEGFLAAVSGHVLGQSDLVVSYERGP